MAGKRLNHTLALLQRLQRGITESKKQMADLRREMGMGFADLRREMVEGFEQVDHRFEQVDRRFDQIDSRFEKVESRLDGVEGRLDARISKLDSDTTTGFQRVVKELQSHRAFATDKLRDHEGRITALEKSSGE